MISTTFFNILRSKQYFPPAWSISKWAMITGADLRLLPIICRVTVKWETATACFFRIKTWKWHQKGIKMCFANPKFFISITWMKPWPNLEWPNLERPNLERLNVERLNLEWPNLEWRNLEKDWTSNDRSSKVTEPRMTKPRKGPNLESDRTSKVTEPRMTLPRMGPNLENVLINL